MQLWAWQVPYDELEETLSMSLIKSKDWRNISAANQKRTDEKLNPRFLRNHKKTFSFNLGFLCLRFPIAEGKKITQLICIRNNRAANCNLLTPFRFWYFIDRLQVRRTPSTYKVTRSGLTVQHPPVDSLESWECWHWLSCFTQSSFNRKQP